MTFARQTSKFNTWYSEWQRIFEKPTRNSEIFRKNTRETICEIILNVQEAKKLIELAFKNDTRVYNIAESCSHARR